VLKAVIDLASLPSSGSSAGLLEECCSSYDGEICIANGVDLQPAPLSDECRLVQCDEICVMNMHLIIRRPPIPTCVQSPKIKKSNQQKRRWVSTAKSQARDVAADCNDVSAIVDSCIRSRSSPVAGARGCDDLLRGRAYDCMHCIRSRSCPVLQGKSPINMNVPEAPTPHFGLRMSAEVANSLICGYHL